MIPNLDPRALKAVMDKLGITSEELKAEKATIELEDKIIIINNPNVVVIEAKGLKTFQITGEISEEAKVKEEVKEEDIEFVMEQTGIKDKETIAKALQEANGDLAKAISILKKTNQ